MTITLRENPFQRALIKVPVPAIGLLINPELIGSLSILVYTDALGVGVESGGTRLGLKGSRRYRIDRR